MSMCTTPCSEFSEVRGRRGPGRRRQRRRCSRRERSHVARRHPRLRVPVVVLQIVGILVGVGRLHGRRSATAPGFSFWSGYRIRVQRSGAHVWRRTAPLLCGEHEPPRVPGVRSPSSGSPRRITTSPTTRTSTTGTPSHEPCLASTLPRPAYYGRRPSRCTVPWRRASWRRRGAASSAASWSRPSLATRRPRLRRRRPSRRRASWAPATTRPIMRTRAPARPTPSVVKS